jgi:hypothetical protein
VGWVGRGCGIANCLATPVTGNALSCTLHGPSSTSVRLLLVCRGVALTWRKANSTIVRNESKLICQVLTDEGACWPRAMSEMELVSSRLLQVQFYSLWPDPACLLPLARGLKSCGCVAML